MKILTIPILICILYLVVFSVLVYGIGCIIFAFMASTLRGHVLQVAISFSDSVSSPMMGLFILGAFFRRTNWLVIY